MSPGFIWEAAVWPRSDVPFAPLIPNPRSVKFTPFLMSLPIPSNSFHWTNLVSTPPCKIKSSISLPTSFSANDVTMAVCIPKHLLRPRATLYSPPPSHALKDLAVLTRPSPGSSRSMISPSEISV